MNKKRITALFFAAGIMLVMTAACSGYIKVNPDNLGLNKAYVFNANIDYDDFNAKASFKRINESHWEINLSEPYALNGLSFVYKSDRISSSFGNLSAEYSAGAESEAIYKLMSDAFENAFCGAGGTVREAEAGKYEIRINGKTGGYAYELCLDRKSKKPLTLKIPAINLSAEFSDADVSDIVVFFQDEEPLDDSIIIVDD